MEVERLRADLERAATKPRADLDFAAAARQGQAMRQRRMARFAGAGVLVVAIVAVPAFLLSNVADAPGEGHPPVGTEGISEPVVALAKAEGWRPMLPTANPRLPYGLVEIAYEQETAERAWDENVPADLVEREGNPAEPGLYGDPDDVDFDTHALVVWSSGQSGTCPGWLQDITTGDAGVSIQRGMHAPGNACTDDYNPYRMVLAVSRDRLPAAEELPADADIEGIGGWVVTYPYSEQGDEREDQGQDDSAGGAFVPPSEIDGDTVRMPVTFPDGTATTLSADRSLGIQRMQAHPYIVGGVGRLDRDIDIFYGSSEYYMAEGPLATYSGHDGSVVEEWLEEGLEGEERCPHLIYRFSNWGAAVRTCQDELNEEEKRIWARELLGRITDDGFLVLEGQGDLMLQDADGTRGASMNLSRKGGGDYIRLRTGRCIRPRGGDERTMSDGTIVAFNEGENAGGAATWCLSDGLRVQAFGSRAFAESAAASLRAEQ